MQKKRETEIKKYDLSGIHILLVDDHPMNIIVVQKMLEDKGIEVDAAANGRMALDMYLDSESGYYDLIIMDIRMPVMDGIQAARAIRAQNRPDASGIPILAMTANTYEEDREETQLAGMNEYLSKPITAVKLYEKIKKWTDKP